MLVPDFVLTEEQIMQMSGAEKARLLLCTNDTCFYHTTGCCRYGRIEFDFVMGVGTVCTTYVSKSSVTDKENNNETNS